MTKRLEMGKWLFHVCVVKTWLQAWSCSMHSPPAPCRISQFVIEHQGQPSHAVERSSCFEQLIGWSDELKRGCPTLHISWLPALGMAPTHLLQLTLQFSSCTLRASEKGVGAPTAHLFLQCPTMHNCRVARRRRIGSQQDRSALPS